MNRAPASCRASSSANTRSSAARSISSVRSPPSPTSPVSRTRSSRVGADASTSSSPARARRQAPIQSPGGSSVEAAIRAYPKGVPSSDIELTERQLEVVDYRGGPLVVEGAAGTGRTTALAARFAALCTDSDLAPEQVVALCRSEADADAMRVQIEDRLERGFSELPVMTVRSLALRLLREELPEDGADPFIAIAARADRLAMLLERVGELNVRHHDFSGNAAALLSGIIGRIDRLKAEMVTADRFARWAAALPSGDEESEREREFAEIFATHDRMLAEEGAMDEGELVLRAIELLGRPSARERIAARHRQLLVDDAQDLSRAALRFALALGSAHGGVAFAVCEDEAISPLALPGGGNLAAIEAELREPRRIVLEDSERCPAEVLAAAEAVVAPIEAREPAPAEARAGGRVEGWRGGN
ncbi:MAG: hypothetical protein FGM34_09670, partial [Solirubrobacteraceae bacterium]|nr:hypothetical protein [Solirubrobacteraceae bacterium]